jgi:hypothetical protein
MYENEQMRLVETIQGMGEREHKGKWWRDDFNYDTL